MKSNNEKIEHKKIGSKTELRIVSGTLRGRKISCTVHEGMRPTPQMVREALFSILGNAIPGRPFFDLFAGTGIVGIESISRGASSTLFIERDAKLADKIDSALFRFNIKSSGKVIRMDVYRWVERWIPPQEPINVYLSPPFADLTHRPKDFAKIIELLCDKISTDSVLTLQLEEGFPDELLPHFNEWDIRKYGRNYLYIWVKEKREAIIPPQDQAINC